MDQNPLLLPSFPISLSAIDIFLSLTPPGFYVSHKAMQSSHKPCFYSFIAMHSTAKVSWMYPRTIL